MLGISHEWSTFYKEVFSSNDNDLQVEVTRQLLICLEHHVYENLFQELSKDKIERIEEELGRRVKGQDAAISKVKEVIIRAYTGFSGLQHSSKQKKPKGTLFFVAEDEIFMKLT